ncbi:hypothetical protein ABZV14_24125 [Streptosporangium canum]
MGTVSGVVPAPVVKPPVAAITVAVHVAVSAARWSETVSGPSCPLIWVPGAPLPRLTGPSGTVIVSPPGAVTVKVTVVGQVVEAGQVPACAGRATTTMAATRAAAPVNEMPRRLSDTAVSFAERSPCLGRSCVITSCSVARPRKPSQRGAWQLSVIM